VLLAAEPVLGRPGNGLAAAERLASCGAEARRLLSQGSVEAAVPDWEGAERRFAAAAAADPAGLEAYVSRGAALESLGRSAEALGSFSRGLAPLQGAENSAFAADALSSRATSLESLDRTELAKRDLVEALRIGPPDWSRRGETLERLARLSAKKS
jgi:tetratricopeptide (TPR) repeat protein